MSLAIAVSTRLAPNGFSSTSFGCIASLVLDAEHWFDMMEEHAELLHATLGTMARTRDAIVEELAAARP